VCLEPDRPHSFLEPHVSTPAPPVMIGRVGELVDSPGAGTTEIAAALSSDPVFLERLLQIVNSPYYDLPVPIRNAKQAVAYLGHAEVCRLVSAVAVMGELRPESDAEFRRFWFHAFHTALAAKMVAIRMARGTGTEEIPIAALLHDLGKLVYLNYFPEESVRLTEYCRRHDLTIIDAEAYLGLPSHAEVGAKLCELWRLPAVVRRASLSHELPDLQRVLAGDETGDDLHVVSLANVLSNLCIEQLGAELKNTIQDAASRTLELRNEAEFLVLMGEMYDLGSKVERLLARL
jgi:HD-like signal output (HDOD) protein